MYALLLVAVAALAWLALGAASRPAPVPAAHDMSAMSMPMSEDEMRAASAAWFAKYPARGLKTTAAPVDSFVTGLTNFNEDGNAATQIDTAHIQVGDAVLFKYGSGVLHSVVNGTGSSDPAMGTLINMPLTNSTQNFTFTFNSPGVVPFFCAIHELSNMKGVIIVNAPAGVGPGSRLVTGFLAPPWPNPSRAGVHCRFALATAGRARLVVVDAQGRRIATVMDRDLPAGETGADWDGRGSSGARAAAGVYFLRLELPGFSDTRRISLTR